jgi:hypothetical protein
MLTCAEWTELAREWTGPPDEFLRISLHSHEHVVAGQPALGDDLSHRILHLVPRNVVPCSADEGLVADYNNSGRPRFRFSLLWPERDAHNMIGSARIRCYLGDQLLENSVGESFIALRRDHEGARTADHVIVVVAVEIGLEREDRQAIDA